jgi:RNA recognition motif-containing protein
MLPFSTSESELRDELEPFGKISNLIMVDDPNTK